MKWWGSTQAWMSLGTKWLKQRSTMSCMGSRSRHSFRVYLSPALLQHLQWGRMITMKETRKMLSSWCHRMTKNQWARKVLLSPKEALGGELLQLVGLDKAKKPTHYMYNWACAWRMTNSWCTWLSHLQSWQVSWHYLRCFGSTKTSIKADLLSW